ncbi:site-2 protease family protein [Streptomyces sp. NPDC058534]|uniref:site-2 protease family protein n=1 Tax=Streptomyces sp. NPDC058534 TaxID=3346541 RepID=UPI00365663D7
MDVSGGSGQPRSGNDESARPQPGPTTPAADGAQPDPAASTTPGTPGPETQRPPAPGSDGPGAEAPDSATPAWTPTPQAPGQSPAETPGQSPAETPGQSPAEATAARNDDETAPKTPDDAAPAADPGRAPNPYTNPNPNPDGPPPPQSPPRPPAHHAGGKPHGRGKRGPGRPPQRRPEPGGGLLMGRPFGVPVYVAPSWFLVAALITWVFGGQLDRVLPELGAARYLVSLFFAVAFYASVLVHELAHTVAALRFKLPVRRIQLQFFGGVSEIEKEAETPGREFVLAFVGPLLSLVLSGVFYLALLPVEPGTVPGVLLAGLMISNLIVAAFNLLPGLPLDGGRMLRAVVWKITGKPMHGTVAAAWVGRALAVSVLIGLPLLTQSGALGSDAVDNVGMDTVMDALLAAILAAIIWTGAGNSLRMARLREHLPELRARALTRRAVPVPADTPLSEALRRANASGARALVVVDTEGGPVSLVREAAIVGVPEHRRPWVPVSTLAQDLTDGMRVSAELSGEELLDALRANPASEYLVIEETGEIYGVLSAADVERAFVKAMARPS